jgi:hypothetical protein
MDLDGDRTNRPVADEVHHHADPTAGACVVRIREPDVTRG